MGTLALISGILGGLCAVMGIITAAGAGTTYLSAEFTAMFWLALGAVLLLASTAFSVGSRGSSID
ncbi:MAG: hypothetical protein V3W01_00890 [Dehalococcoidales bacterium]